MSASWKLTLPCSKDQAEAVADAEIEGAVLVATEEREGWRLDAYFEGEPDAGALAAVRALVPGAAGEPAPVPDQDWVTLSQAGLPPIREGRFTVYTAAHADAVPSGTTAFRIEAGQAFGTGHHETTAGCLAMLESLSGTRFGNVADLGTGSGLLAFAARALWPEARVLATDIDPVAVAVAEENAALNGVEGVRLLVADGARGAVAESGPYDLVIANILAGPLVAMAPEIAAVAAEGATVVLAGLLATQADRVVQAYVAQGCAEDTRLERGDWTILRLTAGRGGGGDASQVGRGDWALDL
jgi:ribosomal protein L11 methyltransferase